MELITLVLIGILTQPSRVLPLTSDNHCLCWYIFTICVLSSFVWSHLRIFNSALIHWK